ncbi:DoxX family protein [Alkalilimnicola sp. S0819]|uniref:DoxX family protein n=1 Tax=Alkalilimnicola sp. S0819 TaxID=2613922 RepID=UPI0012620E09|nr:DoxX family protein [Alkalilimnicola sp. S0819]KAB7627666.1 DoxX family protein [Alkalilimnicola sp. S0819]MPQ15833.1 DoxX family membrane protein [Alkalilimnicola sp. S0819]
MTQTETDNLAKLILRLTLGILILLHGIAKLRSGVSGIEGMLAGHGLPAFIAYGVYIGEVLAPILLIIGYYARVGAALIVVNMLFALFLVHSDEFFQLGGNGGWALELQGMFLFTALALAISGPGRMSLNNR